MKIDELIDAMDDLGTRRVYSAYKSAFLGMGKPEKVSDKLWENIKLWKTFSENDNPIESEYEQDIKDAENKTKELNDNATKKAYYEKAINNAKEYGNKLVGASKLAKADKEVLKEKQANIEKTKKADLDYLAAKKKLAEEAKKESENVSDENNDNLQEFSTKKENVSMNISQKDFNKLMKAMATVNKHFAEDENIEDEDETVVEDEEVVDENEEVTEDEEEEVEDDSEEDDEEMETIELPEDVADAIREALDEAEEDDEEDETESEDDEEEEVVEDDEEEPVEEDMCGNSEQFSMKSFLEFSEAITETIENLNKKVDKIASEITDEAEERTVEFSKKDFVKFAESITNTIENIAARVDAIEVTPKNEVTKDLTNLEQTGDDYEEEFVTKVDEAQDNADEQVVENPEAGVCANCEPNANFETPEQFSKRYEGIKNFLSF